MNDHETGLVIHLKTIINNVAAALGIGTALGVVNLFVGIASAAWLLLQFYGYFKYDLPLKKAKLREMQDIEFQKTKILSTLPSSAARGTQK